MVPTRSGLTEDARRSGQTPFIGCLVNQTLAGQTKALDLALRHPLHGEFLALLGAVEKIEIDQPLVRKAGFVGQAFEIVHDLRTQVDSDGLFIVGAGVFERSEEHTSELQSLTNLVCRLLLLKKKNVS